MRGRRNEDKLDPSMADCEPGCQGCYWERTCDGPPDLCGRCGLALPYTGSVASDESMCECTSGTASVDKAAGFQ